MRTKAQIGQALIDLIQECTPWSLFVQANSRFCASGNLPSEQPIYQPAIEARCGFRARGRRRCPRRRRPVRTARRNRREWGGRLC